MAVVGRCKASAKWDRLRRSECTNSRLEWSSVNALRGIALHLLQVANESSAGRRRHPELSFQNVHETFEPRSANLLRNNSALNNEARTCNRHH